MYFQHGDYNAAVEEYKTGLSMAQAGQTHLKVVLHCNRADAMAALGQHREAITDCCAAIQLDPSYLRAYQLRAKAAAVCALQVSVAATMHQCGMSRSPVHRAPCSTKTCAALL